MRLFWFDLLATAATEVVGLSHPRFRTVINRHYGERLLDVFEETQHMVALRLSLIDLRHEELDLWIKI